MELQRYGRGAGRTAWRIALIVLLAVGAAPVLGNAVSLGAGWIGEGGEYLADLPALVAMTLVELVPFLVLGVGAVRAERDVGLVVVTVASLVVVATSATATGWCSSPARTPRRPTP